MRAAAAITGVLALLIVPVHAADVGQLACPNVHLPPIALPRLRDAIDAGKPVQVVAFGSSSTAGARASDPQHTYPAVLEVDLRRALPHIPVTVINRGVGGQDASEMMTRLESDVLASHPTLIIWQVGANGAMRHDDPAAFQRQIDAGVHQMEAAGADVVLMDNQRSPAVLASPERAKLDQALADVAVRDDARLFARGRLMELWQEAGHAYAEFLDGDGVHHNDRGYGCVAHALSSAIVEGLGLGTTALQAQAAKR